MRLRRLARVKKRRVAPSQIDANQHGRTHALPKTRCCNTQNNQEHGKPGNDAHAPLARVPARRDHIVPYDRGPPTTALTMPHALPNINSASPVRCRCDLFCGTCDIRATVRVRQAASIRHPISVRTRLRASRRDHFHRAPGA
jgi:hypothetical protein